TSPKGTVPVVRRVDGSVLEQSLDILDWVLSISDPAGWKAYPSDVLAAMANLIEENDVSFKQHLDHYKYADRYPDESKEIYRARCHTYLQKLEDRLSVQPHLFSERVSYADAAIFPFVRQFSKVDEQWFAQAPYPALRNWLGRFATGDLFISVMKKYKPWRQGNPSMLFPGI
ncbi:MAG: glutathione S-transferase, partial [Gammaproteobacteria bacterium]|nr:glutathione S-transferase [Gammaproteobacteria bacterium]MBT7541877.1 glutathione S-transferase [Gammaproteobacteria bacterium]